MKYEKKRNLILILVLLACGLNASCGGGSGTSVEDDNIYADCTPVYDASGNYTDLDCPSDSGEEDNDGENTVNTAKLTGTPFEGLTTGDSLPEYTFLCDQYRTDTVVSFPILIFSAFFTEEEEMTIQDGIDIANEGIGFTAYELTDVWEDSSRLIYLVTDIDIGLYSEGGHTYSALRSFDGYYEARKQNTDWVIELTQNGITKWIVAHELGHASGIRSHALIDYENDTLVDLEDGSLMAAIISSSPVFNDYDFMMSMQGQIMVEHLGEEGTLSGTDCNGLKEIYGGE